MGTHPIFESDFDCLTEEQDQYRNMGAKTRTRTQREHRATQAIHSINEGKQPHSIVVPRGKVGKNVGQLTADFRRVMSPYTAANLKVRKGNVMKDFLTIAGPLNVTHLLAFSRTDDNASFRLITTPKGPTLSFAIDKYTLRKDIESSIKRPIVDEQLYQQSPLLIMSGFSELNDQERLMREAFRAMFPKFRHFAIQTRLAAKKKIETLLGQNKAVPDLGKYESVEQFMQAMSGSESEGESSAVANPKTGRQMKVRLTEIGPRFNIRLVKVEDGLCGGAVLWHAYKTKTEEEQMKQEEKKLNDTEQKSERKRFQEENVRRKEEAKVKEVKAKDKQKRRDEAQATARREAIQNGKFSREQQAAGDHMEEKMKGIKRKRGTPIQSAAAQHQQKGAKRKNLSKNQKSKML